MKLGLSDSKRTKDTGDLVPAGEVRTVPAMYKSLLTSPCQLLNMMLPQIHAHLTHEQTFLVDFLHIQSLDSYISFAEYMRLESFFCRAAMSHLASAANPGTGRFKDVKSAMDLVFGWLEDDVRSWIDFALPKDNLWDPFTYSENHA